MDILSNMNENVYNHEDDSTTTDETSRLFGRNLILSVGIHQATPDYISAIIQHQNEYFTLVDYKYLPDLPPPLTSLDLKNETTLTLRDILLNITNLMSTPNQFNIFTQVDKGLTIKTDKKRDRVPQRGITLTYQQSSTNEATRIIDNLTPYLKSLVKEKDHFLLFPNTLPTELISFSPGQGNNRNKYSDHSSKQLKRLSRLRAAAQSTAIVPKDTFARPVPEVKAPPTLQKLRTLARTPAKDRVSTSTPTKKSYAEVIDESAPAHPTASTLPGLPPASPGHSLSTITESQSSQIQPTAIVPVTPNQSASMENALALFRQETEKEFTRHANDTMDTLKLFKTEIARANTAAAEF